MHLQCFGVLTDPENLSLICDALEGKGAAQLLDRVTPDLRCDLSTATLLSELESVRSAITRANLIFSISNVENNVPPVSLRR